MIEIEGLTVRFGGVKSLSELSAVLPERITGFVGPNGAGKTTLLNVLSGFVRPAAGTVRVAGQDVLKLQVHRRAGFGIRRTFQNEQVVENLSVADNIMAVLDNVPIGGVPATQLVCKVLDYVGLAQKAAALGHELNAHDRRMVEIARTMSGTPKLVMMDEPGAGLSQDEAAHLRDVILGIPDFCGAQVLLVDHDVDLISATCQATLVLDFGSKLAYGPTAEVLKDPKVQAAYLGVFEEDAA
ncbi:ABC transporter ATP-binding protein [Mesorhizobium sp. L-8-3]|uniref:ABC transporter ATP-binding protein n=1 Tax=Mesorhizobium sp. L-8-3 TaxID=2744522 RepID=UPI0019292A2B|nr:ATP-binding cassette domain-containing protein [Mesorhizobium sp. L-8-3]BCH22002.1 ABC transporter ATP-binding protein [Mesorhizobium sp. L-8-3]